jgi:hypothetical protein
LSPPPASISTRIWKGSNTQSGSGTV